MTSLTDRLLAILKEPGLYKSRVDPGCMICADLNARYRLKRLCDEIARGDDLAQRLRNNSPPWFPRKQKWNEVTEDVREAWRNQARAAIFAIGEDNE